MSEIKQKQIIDVRKASETMEGAGVKLHRGFANSEVPRYDPFLLFDDFSAADPVDYMAGFPWHPHRGIETVTYILDGSVRHKDSIGSAGVIGKGDVQWMSAGSGIIHEEMPEGTGGIKGFQLWVNIPKSHKMSAPRYQEMRANALPEITHGDAKVKIIAGDIAGARGPVEDIMADPLYADVTLLPEKVFTFPVHAGYTTFIYIFEGNLGEGVGGIVAYQKGDILLFERENDSVVVCAGSVGARFLLVSGKPLDEEVAWGGPIVMNTQEELATAFRELRDGSFIKK